MKFVVLCHPRCGSTLLMEALGQHPAIRQGSEIFNPALEGAADYVAWRKAVMVELYGPRDSYLTEWGYLDDARFDMSLLAQRFFRDFDGTKLMYDQVPPGSRLWPFLQAMPALRVIVLSRNPVAAAVSFHAAMRSAVWHVEAGAENPPIQPLTLEANALAWFYDHFCAPANGLIALFRPEQRLHLAYRDLIADWPGTMARVQRHLGVAPLPLPQRFRQRREGPPQRLVANWDEVRATASRHPVLTSLLHDAEAEDTLGLQGTA